MSRILTLAFLVLVFCAGTFSTAVHAQGNQAPPTTPAPTVTNQAEALMGNPDLAYSLSRECFKDENKTSAIECSFKNDAGITTSCKTNILPGVPVQTKNYCIYRYPDGSRVEADPNNSGIGTTFRNYDSTTPLDPGHLVGTKNTSIILGSETGTGTDAAISASGSAGAGCSPTNPLQCFLDLPGYFLSAIGYLALLLAGFILQIVGVLFNWTIIRTVFQFGTYFGTSDGMLLAWGIMRDIANITLLFGFIFMGVALILNLEGGGHGHGGGMSPRRAIPRLIIFAILLNFSLFASQVVIDVANSFSSVLASQAGQKCDEGTTGGSGSTQSLEDCANVGISGQVMAIAGISSVWDVDNLKNFVKKPYNQAMVLLMLSIFVLVTAVVLLAGCLMLIARAVILSFLMIVSPVGFAAMAIPPLKKIANQWWQTLLSQAFFAPIYLLLVLISLKVGGGIAANPDGQVSLANALIGNGGTSTAGNMQIILVFAVVIGFMVASLLAAKKFGAMGAEWGISTAGAVIGGGTVGLAGFAARRTIGAGAARVMQSDGFIKFARTNPALGRLAYSGLNKGATASFDARGAIKGAPIPLGTVSKAASHGYHGIEEAAVKARTDFAEKYLAQTHDEEDREDELNDEKSTLTSAKNNRDQAWRERERELKGNVQELERQEKSTTAAQAAVTAQNTAIQEAETAHATKAVEVTQADSAIATQEALVQQAQGAVTAQQTLIQQARDGVDAQQAVLQQAWASGDLAARAAAQAELASRQQTLVQAEAQVPVLEQQAQQAQAALAPLQQNKQNLQTQLAQLEQARQQATAALAPLTEAYDAQTATLSDMRTRLGDAAETLKTEEEAYRNANREHTRKMQNIDAELKGGDYTDEAGVVTRMPGITKDAHRGRYAERLATEFTPPLTMAKHANREARRSIQKRLRRDPNDKLIDAIKESSGGGGGGAAKAAAAHAPAAAAGGGGGGHDH